METDRDRQVLRLAAMHGKKYRGWNFTVAYFRQVVGHEPDLSSPLTDDWALITNVTNVVDGAEKNKEDYRLYRFQPKSIKSEQGSNDSEPIKIVENLFRWFRK